MLARVLFLLAAADGLLAGGWVLLRPNDLFTFLQTKPREPLLVLLLGLLALAHAVICALIAWKPCAWGALVLLPLAERFLGMGLWLWYLASGQPEGPPIAPVFWLAVHDAVWIPAFTCFLLVWSRWPRSRVVRSGS